MAIDTPVVVGSVNLSGNAYPIFGTSARAQEYLVASVNGDVFTGSETAEKSRSLISAKRWLDRQKWKTGFPVPDSGLVPLGIEFAQYELAVVLLENPEAINERSTGSNERVLQAGPARIEFFSRTDGSSSSPFSGEHQLPTQALDLIQDYLSSRTSIITPAVGGTSRKSNVLGVDEYGLNEPL